MDHTLHHARLELVHVDVHDEHLLPFGVAKLMEH